LPGCPAADKAIQGVTAITTDMRMDLQYLIDRLESMVTGAKRMPITGKLMLDEQELADLIDQMRTVLPEEVRAARKILRERDSMITEAQQQADEILKTAHEQAEMLLDQQGLMAEAQARSNQYMEEAMQAAQERVNGADDYAREVLSQLQQQLSRHLTIIEKGLNSLDNRE
jgi:cell division septum initiation protein DivIVA